MINKSTESEAQSNLHLNLPTATSILRHRLSPILDEFSLRQTPSRGATASPAPVKGVRKRLHQYHTFDHAVDLLKQSKNVVVLTGAGISTSTGIPDFRSDDGLYHQLERDLGITEPEDFFSREFFVERTSQFFHYVGRVIPRATIGSDGTFKSVDHSFGSKGEPTSVPNFSPTHAFLALLQHKRKLLTNYTQNIDGLESAAGLPRAKFIQCHGSWETASCMTCGQSSSASKYLPVVFSGNIPFCKCRLKAEQNERRKQKKKGNRKRKFEDLNSDHSSDDGTQPPRGLLKPNITFFNEQLLNSYGDRLDEDKRKIDLLIIIGTSLKVGPVQDMLYQVPPKVPQIFISRERFSGALCNLPGVQVDIELLGDCDPIIEELCRRAGWADNLNTLKWESGQTTVKTLNPKLSKDKNATKPEAKESDTVMSEVKIEQATQKRIKIEVSDLNNGHSENHQTETTTKSFHHRNDQPHDEKPIEIYNQVSKSQGEASTDGTDELNPGSQKNRPKTELEVTTDTKPIESAVTIELVEGTSHQWKIKVK